LEPDCQGIASPTADPLREALVELRARLDRAIAALSAGGGVGAAIVTLAELRHVAAEAIEPPCKVRPSPGACLECGRAVVLVELVRPDGTVRESFGADYFDLCGPGDVVRAVRHECGRKPASWRAWP
jgi:hypothetical protein